MNGCAENEYFCALRDFCVTPYTVLSKKDNLFLVKTCSIQQKIVSLHEI